MINRSMLEHLHWLTSRVSRNDNGWRKRKDLVVWYCCNGSNIGMKETCGPICELTAILMSLVELLGHNLFRYMMKTVHMGGFEERAFAP